MQVENLSNLPVWVYIYGGRRILGHGLPYKYGPEYILDKDVIFIVVAYRIGPVGKYILSGLRISIYTHTHSCYIINAHCVNTMLINLERRVEK